MATQRLWAIRTTAGWNSMSVPEQAVYEGFFTTVTLFHNAVPANLKTPDEAWTGEMFDDWPLGLDDSPVISGHSGGLDADNNITVQAATGHEVNLTGTSGARIVSSTGKALNVTTTGQYTTVRGIGLISTAADNAVEWRSRFKPIENCYIENNSASSASLRWYRGTVGELLMVINKGGGKSGEATGSSEEAFFTGCHFNGDIAPPGGDFIRIANCSLTNGTFGAGNYNTSNFNASEDTSAPGATVVNGISNTDYVDYASFDFHSTVGSLLDGAGEDRSGSYTVDPEGNTFVLPYPIGPNVPVAAGGAVFTLTADQGSIVLNGQQSDLIGTYVLTGESGSTSITGRQSLPKASFLTIAENASISITGIDADLLFTPTGTVFTLTADAGSLLINGLDSLLRGTYNLNAEIGNVSINGIDSNLFSTYSLSADSGNIEIDGNQALLKASFSESLATGSISISGQDANLIYTPTSAVFTLIGETGNINISGRDSLLTVNYLTQADIGNVSISGTDADLVYTPSETVFTLIADPGIVNVSGQDANLSANYLLNLESEVYDISGQDANLVHSQVGTFTLVGDGGNVTILGQDSVLSRTNVIQSESGQVQIQGIDSNLVVNRTIIAEHGQININSFDGDLISSYVTIANPANIAITGIDGTLLHVTLDKFHDNTFYMTGNESNVNILQKSTDFKMRQ